MINLHIRNVTSNDLEQVSDIESTCFPAAEAASRTAFENRIAVYPKGFLVAEIDAKMVGFINGGATDASIIDDDFFGTMDLHKDDGKNIVIFGLDVHPDYQRQGIAEALMNAFIENAKSMGKEKILLTCKTHLIHYYAKFGYVNEGLSDSTHGGAEWYDLALTL